MNNDERELLERLVRAFEKIADTLEVLQVMAAEEKTDWETATHEYE